MMRQSDLTFGNRQRPGPSPWRPLEHRLRNILESALLIAAMALIVGLCMWTLWGVEGLVSGLIGAALALALTPSIAPGMVLSLYGARPISPLEAPHLYRVLSELSRRAGLPGVPRIHYIASREVNAFAVGSRDSAVIALTDGILRALTQRELVNVLAHEVGHIASNDLWIMGLADTMSRIMSVMSSFGLVLLALNVPLVAMGEFVFPWPLIVLLVLGPMIMSLLQLALSRSREYNADLTAAMLTGDPRGLASALAKLERHGRIWEQLLPARSRRVQPSLLRTHPPTESRIRRLLDIEGTSPAPPQAWSGSGPVEISVPPAPVPKPRRHWTGVWY